MLNKENTSKVIILLDLIPVLNLMTLYVISLCSFSPPHNDCLQVKRDFYRCLTRDYITEEYLAFSSYRKSEKTNWVNEACS